MEGEHLTDIVRRIRNAVGPFPGEGPSDDSLLARFISQQDAEAFDILLARHGPMVLGVCRHLLRDAHLVEDAFQATFLVLVRRARSIQRRDFLAPWLHGVAHRVARRARADLYKRRAREKQDLESETRSTASNRDDERLTALHEEVARLPRRYQDPVVLCYLRGLTRADTGKRLGCTTEAIRGRLERARRLLRVRLERRELASPGSDVAEALAPPLLSVPLTQATLKASLSLFGSQALVSAVVSSRPRVLAEGVVRTMTFSKLKWTAVCALAIAISGLGAGTFTWRLLASSPADAGAVNAAVQETAKPPPAPEAKKLPPPQDSSPRGIEVPSQHEGVVLFIGSEIILTQDLTTGKWSAGPSPDQVATVKVNGGNRRYLRLKVGDKVTEGQLLAQIDDRQAWNEVAIKKAKVLASEADLEAAEKTRDEAYERYLTAMKLFGVNAKNISVEDVRVAKNTSDRYKSEAVSKKQAVEVTRLELAGAELTLKTYQVRSPVKGVAEAIYKQRGEAVKNLETVMNIRPTE